MYIISYIRVCIYEEDWLRDSKMFFAFCLLFTKFAISQDCLLPNLGANKICLYMRNHCHCNLPPGPLTLALEVLRYAHEPVTTTSCRHRYDGKADVPQLQLGRTCFRTSSLPFLHPSASHPPTALTSSTFPTPAITVEAGSWGKRAGCGEPDS